MLNLSFYVLLTTLAVTAATLALHDLNIPHHYPVATHAVAGCPNPLTYPHPNSRAEIKAEIDKLLAQPAQHCISAATFDRLAHDMAEIGR